MNRRIATAVALCSTLCAATAALVPTAHAGNVAWGVSVGGPGFSVSAGQPGYYGGRGHYRAPYLPIARPYYRPRFPAAYRPQIYAPPVAYPYFAPAAIYYPYSPR
jgi:hypothetical protein